MVSFDCHVRPISIVTFWIFMIWQYLSMSLWTGWNALLAKKSLANACNQLKEACPTCVPVANHAHRSDVEHPSILSACLVSLVADTSLTVMTDAGKINDVAYRRWMWFFSLFIVRNCVLARHVASEDKNLKEFWKYPFFANPSSSSSSPSLSLFVCLFSFSRSKIRVFVTQFCISQLYDNLHSI